MNRYKQYFVNTFVLTFCFGIAALLSSCSDGKDSPDMPTPDKSPKNTTLLIYAVATNSLTGNLVSDKNEMLQAASQIDLDKNNILVFETQYKYLEDNSKVGNVNLLKLVKDKDSESYKWETIKDYNDGVASLNPDRVTEIIDYVTHNFEAKNYGLIFWSHSTASQPYFDENGSRSYSETNNQNEYMESLPMQYSFGQDIPIGNGAPYYQINIDVLADAVPDNLFDYIWFDSCYMSNIETIYQFRNKCKTFVGYPTEVLDSGLPYQYVLPYLVGNEPDLVKAASSFFDYYSNSFATVAVVDTGNIELLAESCKSFYSPNDVAPSSLMKYSRYSTGPFYDFGDYSKSLALNNEEGMSSEEWSQIMDKCILYKATTSGSLLGLSIYEDRFSGISTHLYSFQDSDSQTEKYYKSLDWFKRVF